MQNRGVLTKWNDDRGFGFIKHSETEIIFLHVSAMQRMPRRPREGDVLLYDIIFDASGKKKAACVTIEGLQKITPQKPIARQQLSKNKKSSSIFPTLVVFTVLAILLYQAKTHFFSDSGGNSFEAVEPQNKQSPSVKKTESYFTCQGKMHCSEMTSCAEAKFYLKNCPNQKTDGDGDGIPCESQWCF